MNTLELMLPNNRCSAMFAAVNTPENETLAMMHKTASIGLRLKIMDTGTKMTIASITNEGKLSFNA